MEYNMMSPPFQYVGFYSLTAMQAKSYFEWYITQKKERIELLKNYVVKSNVNITFDFTPESLIELWKWYETKIILDEKTPEELEADKLKYPEWVHSEISRTKISLETLKYGMDVAIYFAEVFIRNNQTIQWGYFTKPKKRMSVNEPTLLGFKNGMDLNPRLIVINCTRHSSIEKKNTRLYDMYCTWMQYVE